jgi:5'-nucleotidase/UDP-sugar diphosphatase
MECFNQMNNKIVVALLIGLVGFLPLSLLADGPTTKPGDGTQTLTILHSNDVHGHLLPFSYPTSPAFRRTSIYTGSMQNTGVLGAFDLPQRRDIGGIARRATLAGRIRTELAAQGTPVWLMDAGDFFFYSPFSNEYHGDADVQAMTQAGYDFGTLGNHEFEVTLDQLKKLVADAHYGLLCANITDNATCKPLTKRYEVRQVGDVRVGIFGLVTNVTNSNAAREGLTCEDAMTVAPKVVAELRGEQKVDIVILISHIGLDMDKLMASKVPGIDVIVGGHSHDRLTQGEFVPWSGELKSDEVNGTVIVQTGQWGGELGRLDLLLKKNNAGQWRVNRYRARLLPVTNDIPDDPGVKALLDKLWAPYSAKYDEVLATATEDFSERGDDLPQNFLYADSVRASLGVDVEFDRTGGVFWPIVQGPVTRASLVDLEQDHNTMTTFHMKGSEIRKYVARMTPVASGIRYRTFHGELASITVGDAALDDAHVYSCAASSSSVGRMNGYEITDVQDTKTLWADAVRDGIRKSKTITPAYDGRRIVVSHPRQWRGDGY